MKLTELLNSLKIKHEDVKDLDFTKITKDSRKCNGNTIYFNINKKYLTSAIKNNAKIIITDDDYFNNKLIVIKVNKLFDIYVKALKFLYLNYNPKIIGITGTSGKTTTTTLLYETLKLANKNILLIGTDGNFKFINNLEIITDTINTTPDIEVIYELIGSYTFDYIILEVSSQGLVNKRISGLLFDIAVFLNISNEHLDFHKTIDNYFASKLLLFRQLKSNGVALINDNLLYKDKIKKICKKYYTFGINKGNYQINYQELNLETMKINIQDKWLVTRLTGSYNAENICAVYGVIKLLRINYNYLIKCLDYGFKVSGRLDILNYKNNKIIVDFAHTEKEVLVLLQYLRKFCHNKLYVIIGCGGDRDPYKRPVIGTISTQYADYVIFTEDNSRSENPKKIINDMLKEIKMSNYKIILNRFEAIKFGISLLKNEDILVVIGKGLEVTVIKNKHYTDMQIVKEVIEYGDV